MLFSPPKQSQRSRFILPDRSKSLGLLWKGGGETLKVCFITANKCFVFIPLLMVRDQLHNDYHINISFS